MKKMLFAALAALSLVLPAAASAATFVYAFAFDATDGSGPSSGERYRVSGTLQTRVLNDYGIAQDLTVTGATGTLTSNFGPTRDIVGATGDLFYFSAFDFLAGGNIAFLVEGAGLYAVDFDLFGGTGSFGGMDGGLTEFSVESAGGIPEPASWAMMIGGFGLAGAALRRRRVRVAFA